LSKENTDVVRRTGIRNVLTWNSLVQTL
jgi:hypothetical protein